MGECGESMGVCVTNGGKNMGKWRENMMNGAKDEECGESFFKKGAKDGRVW